MCMCACPDYAALVCTDGESVDVPMGDAEVVNDCISGQGDGHVRLPILVAASDNTVLELLLPQKCFLLCLGRCLSRPMPILLGR